MSAVTVNMSLGYADDAPVKEGFVRISRMEPSPVSGRYILASSGGKSIPVTETGPSLTLTGNTAYFVEHLVPNAAPRIIKTPSSGSVAYADLPSIDPSTLDPITTLAPAYQAQLDEALLAKADLVSGRVPWSQAALPVVAEISDVYTVASVAEHVLVMTAATVLTIPTPVGRERPIRVKNDSGGADSTITAPTGLLESTTSLTIYDGEAMSLYPVNGMWRVL